MSKLVFLERQKFTQWWIWLIFICLSLVMVNVLIQTYLKVDGKADATIGSTIGIITMALVILLFLSLTLESRIDENGISAKFSPFNFLKKKISWEEIQEIRVRQYSPLREYGGWGYRLGIGGRSAMNVKGNDGIEIKYRNGKTFMLGTQNPLEAKRIISQFHSL